MQFEVPQNIDLEDKILGPMTLRSFLILLFGGLIVYSLFFIHLPKTVAIIIAIPMSIVILLITFVKVQDQPFTKFFTSFVYYSLRPQKRIWNEGDIKPEVTIKGKTQKEDIIHPQKNVSSGQIEKLAQIVDTKGWRPISSETVNGEKINLQNRVTSANQTQLPQTKLESKNAEDILEVPQNQIQSPKSKVQN